MNHERYHTDKAIAQIMNVFIASTYDELKTQSLYFNKIAVTRSFCPTTCQQSQWARLSILQVNFFRKETRLLPLYHIEILNFTLYKTATSMPKMFENFQRPGKTFCTGGSMIQALPRRSRSRRSNESTVESSYSTLEFKIQH